MPETKRFIREISNHELFLLTEEWENSRIDTAKYYESITSAHEVDELTFQIALKDGFICQVYNNRFYVA